jgi:hypothetical protein
MLVKYRAISTKMVDNSLGLIVCEYWKMLKPFIYARRTGEPDWPDDPDPGYYEEFERFAKRISDSTIINPPFDFEPCRYSRYSKNSRRGYRAGSVGDPVGYSLTGNRQRLKNLPHGYRICSGTFNTPTPTSSPARPHPSSQRPTRWPHSAGDLVALACMPTPSRRPHTAHPPPRHTPPGRPPTGPQGAHGRNCGPCWPQCDRNYTFGVTRVAHAAATARHYAVRRPVLRLPHEPIEKTRYSLRGPAEIWTTICQQQPSDISL